MSNLFVSRLLSIIGRLALGSGCCAHPAEADRATMPSIQRASTG
jgi:hypothetical protein